MTEEEYAEILKKIDYISTVVDDINIQITPLVDYIDEQREKEEMIETNM